MKEVCVALSKTVLADCEEDSQVVQQLLVKLGKPGPYTVRINEVTQSRFAFRKANSGNPRPKCNLPKRKVAAAAGDDQMVQAEEMVLAEPAPKADTAKQKKKRKGALPADEEEYLRLKRAKEEKEKEKEDKRSRGF